MSNSIYAGMPEACYSIMPGSGEVIILKLNEEGYWPSNLSFDNKDSARNFVNKENAFLGVTRAQEHAMLVGSMFGFHVPGANPNKYDENGDWKKGE